MSNTKYTYAVARIRALEVSLFSDAFIEQLLACKSAEQVLQSVVEKGWGDMDTGNDAEAVLKREEEKAWEVIRDVAPDMSVFDVLSYPKLYHNLKAAVKEVCMGVKNPAMFYDDCPIPGEEMYRIIENREFSRLPGNMSRTAQEALDTLLTEKSLYCEAHGIKISCVVDGKSLAFLDPVDLYAILGNALDNAVEGVSGFSDKTKRLIDLAVYTRNQFLVITVSNPVEGELQFLGGLPVTTKKDRGYHGFGLRSIRHTVKQYGGHINVSVEHGTFLLKMIIPLPKQA